MSVGIALLSLTPSACWLGDSPGSAQRDAEVEPDVGPTETNWPWGQPELRSTELHSGGFVRFAVADTHLAAQLGVELTINGQPYDLLTIDNLELAALYLDDHVGTLELELRIGNARYTYTATLHDAPAVASVEEFLGAWTSGISADLATIDDPEVRLAGQQNLAMLETSLQELDIEQKTRLVTILLANDMLPTSYARAACPITTPEEWTGCFRSQLIDAIEAAGVGLVGISAGLGLSTFLGPLAPVVVFASATYSAVHVMQLLDTLLTIGARAVSRVADEVVLKAVIGEVQGFSPGVWFDYTIEGRYVGVADVEPTPDQSVLHSLKTSVREGGAMVRDIFSRLGVVREVPEPTLNITERRVLPASSFTVAEVTEGWTADIETGAEGGLRLRLDYVSGDNRNSPSVTLRYVHEGVLEEHIYAHFYVAAPDGCDQHGFAADTRVVDTCGNAVLDASEACDTSSPTQEERCTAAGVDCEVRMGESDVYSLERTQLYGPALVSLEHHPNLGYVPTNVSFDGGNMFTRSGICESLDLWGINGEVRLQVVDRDALRSLVLRESTTIQAEHADMFNMEIDGLGTQPSVGVSIDLIVGNDSSGSPATVLDVTNPLDLAPGVEARVPSPSYFRVSSTEVPLAFRNLENGDRVLVVDGMVTAEYLQMREANGSIYMDQGVPVSISSSYTESGWKHVIEDQTLAIPEGGSVSWDYDHAAQNFSISGQRDVGVRRSTGGGGDSTVMVGDQAIALQVGDSIDVCGGVFRGSMTLSVRHMQDEGGRWHVVPSHASSGMDVGMGRYDVNGCNFRGTAPIFVTIDAGEFGCNSVLDEGDVNVLAGGHVACERSISVAGPAIVPMTTSWFGGDDPYAHWRAHVSSGSVVSALPGGWVSLGGVHLSGPGSLQVAQRNLAEWPWAAWIVDPEAPATAGHGGHLGLQSLANGTGYGSGSVHGPVSLYFDAAVVPDTSFTPPHSTWASVLRPGTNLEVAAGVSASWPGGSATGPVTLQFELHPRRGGGFPWISTLRDGPVVIGAGGSLLWDGGRADGPIVLPLESRENGDTGSWWTVIGSEEVQVPAGARVWWTGGNAAGPLLGGLSFDRVANSWGSWDSVLAGPTLVNVGSGGEIEWAGASYPGPISVPLTTAPSSPAERWATILSEPTTVSLASGVSIGWGCLACTGGPLTADAIENRQNTAGSWSLVVSGRLTYPSTTCPALPTFSTYAPRLVSGTWRSVRHGESCTSHRAGCTALACCQYSEGVHTGVCY